MNSYIYGSICLVMAACQLLPTFALLLCLSSWAQPQSVLVTQARLLPLPLGSAQWGMHLDPSLLSCRLRLRAAGLRLRSHFCPFSRPASPGLYNTPSFTCLSVGISQKCLCVEQGILRSVMAAQLGTLRGQTGGLLMLP